MCMSPSPASQLACGQCSLQVASAALSRRHEGAVSFTALSGTYSEADYGHWQGREGYTSSLKGRLRQDCVLPCWTLYALVYR